MNNISKKYLKNWILSQSENSIDIDLINLNLGIIYIWINKINGMIYVGQTISLLTRMGKYKSNTLKDQPKLHRAVQKYGWDNFKLEFVECDIHKDKLNIKEKWWIKYLNTFDIYNENMGYNLTDGGTGFTSGEAHPNKKDKNRFAQSERMKGDKNPIHKPEIKEKIILKLKGSKPNYSPETLEQKRINFTGDKNPNSGKSMNPKIKEKMIMNQPNRTQVICHQNNKIYISMSAAAKELNINKANLSKHLQGKYKQINGYTFSYLLDK